MSELDKLQEHVVGIARELGAILEQGPGVPGMMYVEEQPPRVECPTITNAREYYINLHELGHVYHEHTQGRPPFLNSKHYFENGVLLSEAEAWDFALNSAIVPVPPGVGKFMRDNYIGSYLREAERIGFETKGWHWGTPGLDWSNGNRHYVEFAYGTPGKFFWDVMDRLYMPEEVYARV